MATRLFVDRILYNANPVNYTYGAGIYTFATSNTSPLGVEEITSNLKSTYICKINFLNDGSIQIAEASDHLMFIVIGY